MKKQILTVVFIQLALLAISQNLSLTYDTNTRIALAETQNSNSIYPISFTWKSNNSILNQSFSNNQNNELIVPNNVKTLIAEVLFNNGSKDIKSIVIDDDIFRVAKNITSNFLYEEKSILEFDKPKIACYPNPARDFMYINIENAEKGILYILNSEGKLIMTMDFDASINTTIEIETNDLSSGNYYYQIIAKNYIESRAFVKAL